MLRRQWGEEVGKGYELASSPWARRLHARTRSGVECPGISISSLGDLGPSSCTVSCKMYVTQTSTTVLISQWMETKCGFKLNTG